MTETVNVLIVGVGGQGVLKASQVLSEVLVRQGFDVKQSEVHGMSQRGGSVVSEVRYGSEVHSPLTPYRAADYIVALDANEAQRAEPRLRHSGGRMIEISEELADQIEHPRSHNMAALGRLSALLDIPPSVWHEAIRRCLPAGTIETNIAAFEAGRSFDN